MCRVGTVRTGLLDGELHVPDDTPGVNPDLGDQVVQHGPQLVAGQFGQQPGEVREIPPEFRRVRLGLGLAPGQFPRPGELRLQALPPSLQPRDPLPELGRIQGFRLERGVPAVQGAPDRRAK
jgi:hypothetical protein